MKVIPAIAAVPYQEKSRILGERKIVCVILDGEDMDKIQDRMPLTINIEEQFSEMPKCSLVICYHSNTAEAVQAFKESFNLIYMDGRKV